MSQVIEHPARNIATDLLQKTNETLDPADWQGFRRQAHRMLDDMLAYVENIRERPVWQPMPADTRAQFRSAAPRTPSDIASVHDEFMQKILPFTVGNVHPGFMGWVHGGGTPVGMLAEMLAGGLNANLGGRDHAPIEVERQVVQWTREIFGFPESATGLFVTGTSMANLIAVIVARDAALGFKVRQRGMNAETKQLTAYASTAVHGCIGRAMDIAGLGSDALRLIPTDSRHRIDLAELERAIERDRDAGFSPFLVVGSAGTVDTGAIDALDDVAELCRREKLWFHVDGAYGALAMLAPDLAPRLQGIERADSLAFDFHKWGQAPYDAGFILVRDGELHKNAFASPGAYLQRTQRGLAAGATWPCDLGPDLSRGFRALKTWMTLKVHGTEALGAVISRTCELARYLENRVLETGELELMAPVELNIVCFHYRSEDTDRVNEQIAIDLQESGIVALSTTRIDGRVVIRAAIVNHRTSRSDIDALIDGVLSFGRAARKNSTAHEMTALAPEIPLHTALQSQLEGIEEQLTSQPDPTALLFRRGTILEQLDRSMEARDAWAALLELEPAHPGALNSLGNLLFAAGENAEARKMYDLAIASHPDDPMSRVNLANLFIKTKEPGEARRHLEHALEIDPSYRPAHAGLSFVLADLGEPEKAASHRRTAFQGRCVIPAAYRGKEPPVTVLELISTCGGNLRTDSFLTDRVFKKYLVAAEFYNPATTALPPHELIVNAIGDADVASRALAGAQSVLTHTTAPVINAPVAVLATGRCDIARRLARVPGVVTPKVVTLPRELLDASDAETSLASHGFTFPLLLRTPGFHGGDHFLRVETADELPAALAELPGRELTIIEYLDARGRDGKTRKYRVMMIDGQLYPLHAAISKHWKIHYFSADMTESPEHRAEDSAFLGDMGGVIGSRALAALKEIQATLGLDYGGVDFGLNQEGEILLFEANATMAFFPPGEDSRWDYRRPAVEAICRAIRKMLLDRAAKV